MIQSVDRSVRILLALQGARRLSLSDLAAQLGLPNSTVHGILRTLAAHGMVEQEPGSLRYMLGPAVLRLSSVYLDSLEFRSRTLKWAEELARRSGAPSGPASCSSATSSSCTTSPAPTAAARCPKSASSSPPTPARSARPSSPSAPTTRTARSADGPLRSMTGETIVDAPTLREHLSTVHRTGVAAEHDEAVLGESSLAAPVFDATGTAVGAVAVVLPSSEWPPSRRASRRPPRSGAEHLARTRRNRLARLHPAGATRVSLIGPERKVTLVRGPLTWSFLAARTGFEPVPPP